MSSLFETGRTRPDMPELLSGWALFSLDAYSESEKALFMVFFLKRLEEYLVGQPQSERPVRAGLQVDETHLIAPRTGMAQATEGAANPQAYASKAAERILREFRKLSVATFWGDQNPHNVADDLVRMTGSKLIGRLLAEEDRHRIGSTVSLGSMEREHLIQLEPGQAYFHTEGYARPQLIRTVPLHKRMELSRRLLDEELLDALRGETWLEESRSRIGLDRLILLGEKCLRFEERRLSDLRFVKVLGDELRRGEKQRGNTLRDIAAKRKTRVIEELKEFRFRYYDRIIHETKQHCTIDVTRLREQIIEGFEHKTVPTVELLVSKLDKLAHNNIRI